MFERLIYEVLNGTLDKILAKDAKGKLPLLDQVLRAQGFREEGEIQALIEYFSDRGKPGIRHGYSVGGPPMPCISIILGNESTQGVYLGNNAGESPEAIEFVDEVEAKIGRAVDAKTKRMALTYNIFCYSDHPDVTIALYGIVRDAMFTSEKPMAGEGMETPDFSGQDLAPDPRYMPEKCFVRAFTIQTFGHYVFATDLDLGRYATGRATKVTRVHVANNVLGDVNPGVTVAPSPPDEE